MAAGERIFVPDIGFRPAEVGIARVPVTRGEAGRTVTVERAVSGPDGVELVLTIVGAIEDTRQMPPFANDPATLREASGRLVGQRMWPGSVGRAGVPGASHETVRRTLAVEPLSPGTRSAELRVSGVTVPLEFEPGTIRGVPAHALDVVVELHGIAVAARWIAFTADGTAIELEVSVRDERSSVYMIGLSVGPNECDIRLHDDAGRIYGGQRSLAHVRGGREFREVAVFPTLPADVHAISLEIADVYVIEQTDDLTLPVGFDGDITLGGLSGHAKVMRESDEQRRQRKERVAARASSLGGHPVPPEEPWGHIEMECDAGQWLGDRRLIRPNGLWLTDRRMGWSTSFSARGWVLSAADPSGDARDVTISSVLVQYRGPWRVEIPLAARS